MPPPQAEPIISGYHCDVMETFGDPSNVMKDPGVVDGENAMNTDDKVDSLIMLLTGFLWNITSLTFCNIIRPLNIVFGAEERTIPVDNKLYASTTIPVNITIHSLKPGLLAPFMDFCTASIMCAWDHWLTKQTTIFTVSVPPMFCDPLFHSPSACTRT